MIQDEGAPDKTSKHPNKTTILAPKGQTFQQFKPERLCERNPYLREHYSTYPWSILDPNVRTCSNIKHEVSQPICTSENQRGPAPAMRWALQSPLGSAPILRRCPLRSRSFLQASSVKLHIYSSSTVVVAVWWFLMVFGGFWLFEDCWLGPRRVFFFFCVCFFGESWN
jgi:hypothetical protein